jgi:hypothetical protein
MIHKIKSGKSGDAFIWWGGFRIGKLTFSWNWADKSIWGYQFGRCWNSEPEKNAFSPGFHIAIGRLYINLGIKAFYRNEIS